MEFGFGDQHSNNGSRWDKAASHIRWGMARDVLLVMLMTFFCVMSWNMSAAVTASANKALQLVEEDQMTEHEWWIRVSGVCVKTKVTYQTPEEAYAKMLEAHAIHAPATDCP